MANPKTSVLSEWNSEGYRLNANLGARVSDTFSILGTASKLNRDLYYKDTYRNSEYYSLGGRWDLRSKPHVERKSSH